MRHLGKLAIIIFFFSFLSSALFAKKNEYTISGQVIDSNGDKVPTAEVLLLDVNGKEADKTSTGKRFMKKGDFKFKDVKPGDYTISASKADMGYATKDITIQDEDIELVLDLVKQKTKTTEKRKVKPREQIDRIPDDEYIINELSFEMKKLTAEVNHLGSKVRDLEAKSEMWVNPLGIYNKEIILENGSTVFGKVVYQDDEVLKVETLVGYLVIDRNQVVRIIENVIGQEEPEYIPEQIRETYTPPPMPKLAEPKYVSVAPSERRADQERVANVVLVGNISERKDRANNISFSGEVKNIGGRRADFVKVNFVFRKDWSGETKTLTTFIRGSYHTFDSGITTDSSLLPGATGTFELLVPPSFGSFIGYSYTIDWEEYE